MSSGIPWPAVGALLSGVVSLYFIRYLWPYRDRLGGGFFIATIGCEALWALSYGVALLVFDPELRRLFELPIWLGINFIGVSFLAFALEYTGRSSLVWSKWMGVIVAVQCLHTLVVWTNPFHHIAWSNYRIVPVFGAATVSYSHQPWLFLDFAGLALMVAAGGFLLADTFFSYGRLYRGQTAAIALSPILPGVAFLLWLFEVGGTPPLNLTPLTFPIHLGFDMYAFFRRNMFELTPAARRIAERAAIDDLGSAVVILNDDGTIIEANAEAQRVFGTREGELLNEPLEAFVDLSGDQRVVPITVAGERREYAVSTSPVADPTGTTVGRTMVFQDITAQRQREQRLTVLNRVLRHNLRNDLNVVRGMVEIAQSRVEDDDLQDKLRTANAKTGDVIELGEKARTSERLMSPETAATDPVPVRALFETIADELQSTAPDGTIELQVPEGLRVPASRDLLEVVFRNLLENALEHNGADAPLVEVTVAESGMSGSVTFAIEDNGPGIPEQERTVIETGEETDLEHGSGLGLWLVRWGVTSIGGDLRFEVDDDGTTVLLRLPRHDDAGDGSAVDPTSGAAERDDRP